MMFESGFPLSVVVLAAVISGVTDVWKYRVYNWLTIPLALSGLVFHLVFHGWAGLCTSTIGMAFGFAVLIMPYALGLMGAGDVKLLAGIGAWLGVTATAWLFVATAMVSGVVSLLLIVIRGEFEQSWFTIKMIIQRLVMAPTNIGKDDFVSAAAAGKDRRLRVIPFAAMVPLGMIVAFLCDGAAGF